VIPFRSPDDAEAEVHGAWNGVALLAVWIDYLRSQGLPEPGVRDMAKFGAVAKRVAEQYGPEEVFAAMLGIGQLYPHSKGEPWDLFDLERKFTKAMAGANQHPEVKRRRFIEEFGGG
jgi:hypothetical protein